MSPGAQPPFHQVISVLFCIASLPCVPVECPINGLSRTCIASLPGNYIFPDGCVLFIYVQCIWTYLAWFWGTSLEHESSIRFIRDCLFPAGGVLPADEQFWFFGIKQRVFEHVSDDSSLDSQRIIGTKSVCLSCASRTENRGMFLLKLPRHMEQLFVPLIEYCLYYNASGSGSFQFRHDI